MVLAIESTCDETGAALVSKKSRGVTVIKNVLATSGELQVKYGGVVPEVAAREQVKVIIPVIEEAVGEQISQIEAVAVACGPGLIGSLLIGVETAKALAWAWNKSLLAVNHLEAHLLANWIDNAPELPAVGLVVSGGHTELLFLKSMQEWRWLGGTRDDAAGECFDKCARALGLSYPGGPAIEKLISQVSAETEETLPRPLIHEDTYDFSFSGLKTALVREAAAGRNKVALAYDLNRAVVEILLAKINRAMEEFGVGSVVVGGGVSANQLLRRELMDLGIKVWLPKLEYCVDNAAMVGAAALLRPRRVEALKLRPEPGLNIEMVQGETFDHY